MIRPVLKKDYRDIRILLEENFTSDAGYLDLFLNQCNSKLIIGYEKEGKIVSTLSAMPISYVCKETEKGFHKTFHGLYVYAVCTGKEYRKQGFSSALIDSLSLQASSVLLDFLILRPTDSSPKLIRFYNNLGFSIPLFRRENLPPFETSKNIRNLSPSSLFLLRKREFLYNYFEWSPLMLDYIIREAELNPSEEISDKNRTYAILKPLKKDFKPDNNEAVFSYPME